MPGANEAADLFGLSLASMTAPTGTAANLVISAIGEDVGAVSGAGSVVVLPGAPGGVTGAGSVSFNPTGLLNGGGPNAEFGLSLG